MAWAQLCANMKSAEKDAFIKELKSEIKKLKTELTVLSDCYKIALRDLKQYTTANYDLINELERLK